jgi:serine/threonine protein kinase
VDETGADAYRSLSPGDRIGPYEVIGPVGAGGMGEVYRARDERLRREVALKIVSARCAPDPARLARFAREAQILAALNHPNIAALYGLEDERGLQALVLELVDGEPWRIDSPRNPAACRSRRRCASHSRSRPGSRPRTRAGWCTAI